MEKVTLHINHATAKELSDLLTGLLVCPPNAPASKRLALFVVNAWRKKKLWVKMLERTPKGYKLPIDAPTAFALRTLLEDVDADPTTRIGICLLRLFDDIQKTFYTPFFLPDLLMPLLPGSAPPALLSYPEQHFFPTPQTVSYDTQNQSPEPGAI